MEFLTADGWTDFELLDTGSGMKRERWGDYILVRPDPQVLWPQRDGSGWSEWDGYYHRSPSGGGEWEFRRPLPESWTIRYRRLQFKVKPTGFKHTGLFPEQAVNWDWMTDKITAAGRKIQVLNLFGYTGAATVAAAAAGASVCHVDAAEGMVRWCRENVAVSGLTDRPVRYIVDDCLKFVRRELRRGRRYDAVVMDPPTYGRGSTGEMWRLEDSLWELLSECGKLLSDRPLFFLLNAYTARLSPLVAINLLNELLGDSGKPVKGGELGLRSRNGDKVLPCGIYARWES